jgi:hypothetical protein
MDRAPGSRIEALLGTKPVVFPCVRGRPAYAWEPVERRNGMRHYCPIGPQWTVGQQCRKTWS